MRKFAFGLILAAALPMPAHAQADSDTPAVPPAPEAPPPPPPAAPAAKPIVWNIFVEGSYLLNGNSNRTPYAQYYGPDLNTAVDSRQFPFKVGGGHGYQVAGGIGAHFEDGWSLELAYTGLRSHRHGDTGMFPDYPIISVLANGYESGETGIGSSWNQAKVKTDIAGDIVDFDAGYDVGLGSGVSGAVIGGIRYAQFRQTTDVQLFDSDGILEFSNHRRSRFTGIGPSLGFRLAAPLGHGGFGLEASVLGSALFGHIRSRTTGADSDGDPVLTRRLHFSHTAWTANSEIGATYTGSSGLLHGTTITAGYQLSFYGGVRDTANGESGDGTAHYGKRAADLLYHGPFLRLGFTF